MQMREAGAELLIVLAELAVQGPVFTWLEILDFYFAFYDHAQRRTLHTSGRQATPHLLPQ